MYLGVYLSLCLIHHFDTLKMTKKHITNYTQYKLRKFQKPATDGEIESHLSCLGLSSLSIESIFSVRLFLTSSKSAFIVSVKSL